MSGHFAKCCISSKRNVNPVRDEKESISPALDCDFFDIEDDSEPEYGVLKLEETVQINSIELLTTADAGRKRSLGIWF